MSDPQYIVSYVVMDEKAGANPFHHAFLMFSTKETAQSTIQVRAAFGFYSQPSKSSYKPLDAFWQLTGITFKLQNSHGVLKTEKLRELDGQGLKAKHYEVDVKKYEEALQLCKKQKAEEEKAIAEQKETHGNDIQPEQIYANEIANARKSNRKPRVKAFEVKFSFHPTKGFHTKNSYTCKAYALEVLKNAGIINNLQCKIDNQSFGYAFPCTSGEELEPLHLYSTGELQTYTSPKKKKFLYRHWEKGAELYFALPPKKYVQNNYLELNEEVSHLKALQEDTLKFSDETKDEHIEANKEHTDTNEDHIKETQEKFKVLYEKTALIDESTPPDEIITFIDNSQRFRKELQPPQKTIQPKFLLLNWEKTNTLILAASTIALFIALSTLSGGTLAVAATIATSAVLVSSYGLFKNKETPAKEKSSCQIQNKDKHIGSSQQNKFLVRPRHLPGHITTIPNSVRC